MNFLVEENNQNRHDMQFDIDHHNKNQMENNLLIDQQPIQDQTMLNKSIKLSNQAPIQVFINYYDLCKCNSLFHCLGLGAYHVGIQLCNREYSGTESGLIDYEPTTYGGCYKFRESLFQGNTNYSEKEILELIDSLRPDYPKSGDNYHLFKNNCQNFCDRICKILGVNLIPNYITRVPRWISCFSCLCPEFVIKGDL